MLDIFTLIISIAALLSSFYIGKKQYELAQMQAVAQNKTELYLLVQTITLRDASGNQPDKALPAIYIRNIGNNVVYLDKYLFNGRLTIRSQPQMCGKVKIMQTIQKRYGKADVRRTPN